MSSHTDKQCRKQKKANDAAQIAVHQWEDNEWSNEQRKMNYHSFVLHFHETENEDIEEPDEYSESTQAEKEEGAEQTAVNGSNKQEEVTVNEEHNLKMIVKEETEKVFEKRSETENKRKLNREGSQNNSKIKAEESEQQTEVIEITEIMEIVEIIEIVEIVEIIEEIEEVKEIIEETETEGVNTDQVLHMKDDEEEPYENLLVDSGASSNIATDTSKFVQFQEDFDPKKHSFTLANGDIERVAEKRGTILIHIRDETGVIRDVYLEDTLYCPSYPQDIFSVKAALRNGGKGIFNPNDGELIMKDGTKFPIGSTNGLYHLDLFEKADIDT